MRILVGADEPKVNKVLKEGLESEHYESDGSTFRISLPKRSAKTPFMSASRAG